MDIQNLNKQLLKDIEIIITEHREMKIAISSLREKFVKSNNKKALEDFDKHFNIKQ